MLTSCGVSLKTLDTLTVYDDKLSHARILNIVALSIVCVEFSLPLFHWLVFSRTTRKARENFRTAGEDLIYYLKLYALLN